jgi:hypothetical protein
LTFALARLLIVQSLKLPGRSTPEYNALEVGHPSLSLCRRSFSRVCAAVDALLRPILSLLVSSSLRIFRKMSSILFILFVFFVLSILSNLIVLCVFWQRAIQTSYVAKL